MLCASCKNRTSDDRCSNKALKGLILCGKHAKAKNPRMWKDVNKLDDKAILIQKIWRGHSVRNWLSLAGPGVLKRSVCHNEEELFTFDDKKSVYPLDYFAFSEAGKVYWFDIRSIVQNSEDKVVPVNPYTREPLDMETRHRLRKLMILRDYRDIKSTHDSEENKPTDDLIRNAWITVCQIIEENGFQDMSPMHFLALNKSQLYIFINLVYRDMIAWAAEHTTPTSRRKRYLNWIRRLSRESFRSHINVLSYMTAKCLTAILIDYPEQYSLSFIIMSALHRV